MKRLQEKTSCYNVYDWEIDRKKQVKMIKKICYYPPSLVKRSRLRSKRAQGAAGIDPNYEVYNYYQSNLKATPGEAEGQWRSSGIEEAVNDEEEEEHAVPIAEQNRQNQHQYISSDGLLNGVQDSGEPLEVSQS